MDFKKVWEVGEVGMPGSWILLGEVMTAANREDTFNC